MPFIDGLYLKSCFVQGILYVASVVEGCLVVVTSRALTLGYLCLVFEARSTAQHQGLFSTHRMRSIACMGAIRLG